MNNETNNLNSAQLKNLKINKNILALNNGVLIQV